MGKININIISEHGKSQFFIDHNDANIIDFSLTLAEIEVLKLKLLNEVIKISSFKEKMK